MASREVVYRVKVLDLASGRMREIEASLQRTGRAAQEADSSTARLGGSLGKIVKGGAIAAGVATIGNAIVSQGKAAVSAAAQVERYNATLETMLGSKSAARDRMQEYMDIAKYTPFELTQVVEAGNQLQALGRYSEETLTMLGDLAAASGKPLEQVMGAYAKMASGQKGIAVDMFRDLLITNEDWVKATGKGRKASGEMLATTDELLAALPKVMKSKGFFGLMAKQAATTEGQISNLNDAVFSLRASLGERLTPAVKSVTGVLSGWVDTMEAAVRVPLPEKIAKEQAELNTLVGRLINANGKEEERRRIIAELNREYPDFVKKIDLEKATTEELRSVLAATNREYEKKIRLAVYGQKMEELQKSAEKEMSTIADVEIAKQAKQNLAEAKKNLGRITGAAPSKRHHLVKNKGEWMWEDDLGNRKRISSDKKVQANIEMYMSQMKAYDELAQKENAIIGKKDAAAAQQRLDEVKAQMDVIDNLMSGEDAAQASGQSAAASEGSATSVASGGGPSSGSGSGGIVSLGSARGGSGGGGHVVNIGTLVGKLEIHTTTLNQSAAEVKALMTQVLTEVVNEQ